jgi:hypothetical protein
MFARLFSFFFYCLAGPALINRKVIHVKKKSPHWPNGMKYITVPGVTLISMFRYGKSVRLLISGI